MYYISNKIKENFYSEEFGIWTYLLRDSNVLKEKSSLIKFLIHGTFLHFNNIEIFKFLSGIKAKGTDKSKAI